VIGLGEGASIRAWYEFLEEECDLRIGQDWRWAWRDNCWAVEFMDPRIETKVRLKMRDEQG